LEHVLGHHAFFETRKLLLAGVLLLLLLLFFFPLPRAVSFSWRWRNRESSLATARRLLLVLERAMLPVKLLY
jgi:hypothetical protein